MDLNMVDHPEDVVKVVINNVDMEVGGVCCLVGSCLSNTVITSLQAFRVTLTL